jgi:aminoglycoside phosphotransferase (APT) family kinase protein
VVAHGSVDGASYLIVRRKPGSTLARWWPDMRTSQRQDAVEQLAGCLRAIHFTEIPDGLAPVERPPQMLGSAHNPTLPLLQGLQQLRSNRHIPGSAIDDLETKVLALGPAVDDYTETRMIHGDLTFENVLWDGSRITAILDFEWARGAPRDLDLDVICRYIQWPHLHVDPAVAGHAKPSDYTDVLSWLDRSYPELFSHRLLRRRLALYCIAFDLRATLQNPPDQRPDRLPPMHPYSRLVDAGETGGPGARLLTSMASTARSPR